MEMGPKRKRGLLLVVAAITTFAAVATLVAGVTLGLFSSTVSSGENTITAGTVTVGLDPAGTQVTCAVTGVVPGDSSTGYGSGSATRQQCRFDVKYTGSVSAYLGLDLAVTSPNVASNALYDQTASGLQLLIKDGTPVTYVNGTTYKDASGASQPLTTSASNLLVSASSVSNGATRSFRIDYLLPSSAGNTYQGGDVKIVLTFHAVQATSNALNSSCTTAGFQCPAGNGFLWS